MNGVSPRRPGWVASAGRWVATVVLVWMTAGLAACGAGVPSGGPSPEASAGLTQGNLAVRDAWLRVPPGGSMVTAGYLTVENHGPEADRLLGATSAIAPTIELHQSSMTNGRMSMAPVDGVDLAPGARVELKPGGLHLMVIGVNAPLKAGDTVDLALRFEKAGELKVTAAVRDQ